MRIVHLAIAATVISAAPLAANTTAMSLATFLSKAEKLEKKGPLALFSGDLKILKREVNGAADSYKAQIKAAKRTAHSCPPKGGSMDSDELLAHFRSYPAVARAKTTVKVGFFDLMKKKYPC